MLLRQNKSLSPLNYLSTSNNKTNTYHSPRNIQSKNVNKQATNV